MVWFASLRSQIRLYIILTRMNKPIGSLLLLWPTWTALWFSAHAESGEFYFDLKIWAIFTLGVLLMRSVGCIINDVADRDFDKHVARTNQRPITTGLVSAKEALLLSAFLSLIAFTLVCFTNIQTILLSIVALALAATYPFMKRVTYFPQVVLGLAFAWAVPMAYMAQLKHLPVSCWLLFAATVAWAVAYDTFYAMVDKEDDLKIGLKSTAIWVGAYDRVLVAFCHAITLACYLLLGISLELSIFYFLAIVVAAGLAVHQQWQVRLGEPQQYFKAFLANNHFGAALCFGSFLGFMTS
jgi:4-hydroxybenzoate polyprenyltransferase